MSSGGSYCGNSTAAVQSPIRSVTEKVGEIQMVRARLQNSLDELRDVSERLRDRLDPITSNPPPAPADSPNVKSEGSNTKFGSELVGGIEHLECSVGILRYVLRNLEI